MARISTGIGTSDTRSTLRSADERTNVPGVSVGDPLKLRAGGCVYLRVTDPDTLTPTEREEWLRRAAAIPQPEVDATIRDFQATLNKGGRQIASALNEMYRQRLLAKG